MSKPMKKPQRKLRILWNSNAPWAHSGYSVQTRDVVYRLHNAGFPIAVNCFYGLEGASINVGGVRCYPKLMARWGEDGCIENGRDFNADIVITMQDIWNMDYNLTKRIKNWVPYVPIDFEPLPESFKQRLKLAYRIISFSRWGQKTLEDAGFASKLILEGVDTNLFKPMNKKKELRKRFGLPEDAFMFGMVAANKENPPRKEFQRVLDAFLQFKREHPEAHIFFHTLLTQPGGFPIKEYASKIGVGDSIHHFKPYETFWKSDHNIISSLMNTFDCLLNPSNREGFGLPIIEAQACGVPVIATDATAMSELVISGKTGFLVPVEQRRWTPVGGYVSHPSTQGIYKAMESVFEADREAMGKTCRKEMVQKYDISDRVNNEWIPYLEELENEVYKDKGGDS